MLPRRPLEHSHQSDIPRSVHSRAYRERERESIPNVEVVDFAAHRRGSDPKDVRAVLERTTCAPLRTKRSTGEYTPQGTSREQEAPGRTVLVGVDGEAQRGRAEAEVNGRVLFDGRLLAVVGRVQREVIVAPVVA